MNNIVIAVIAIFASTGFWQFVIAVWQSKKKNQSDLEKGVIALLHNELYDKAERYIKRGGITINELDNLRYLYTPYSGLGGNGTGEKLYKTCLSLPIITEEEAYELDQK